MARAGMTNLITRWRRLVNDTAGSVWTDAEAEEILDGYRVDLYRHLLTPQPLALSGTTQYKIHLVGYGDLEEAASGTAAFFVWDATGSAIGTTNYSTDYQRGIITFTADQLGSARYLDARAFDLHGAAAQGWRELASAKAELYSFQADGAQYDRQQWFDHCMQMSEYYEQRSTTGSGAMTTGLMTRSDVRFWS